MHFYLQLGPIHISNCPPWHTKLERPCVSTYSQCRLNITSRATATSREPGSLGYAVATLVGVSLAERCNQVVTYHSGFHCARWTSRQAHSEFAFFCNVLIGQSGQNSDGPPHCTHVVYSSSSFSPPSERRQGRNHHIYLYFIYLFLFYLYLTR